MLKFLPIDEKFFNRLGLSSESDLLRNRSGFGDTSWTTFLNNQNELDKEAIIWKWLCLAREQKNQNAICLLDSYASVELHQLNTQSFLSKDFISKLKNLFGPGTNRNEVEVLKVIENNDLCTVACEKGLKIEKLFERDTTLRNLGNLLLQIGRNNEIKTIFFSKSLALLPEYLSVLAPDEVPERRE